MQVPRGVTIAAKPNTIAETLGKEYCLYIVWQKYIAGFKHQNKLIVGLVVIFVNYVKDFESF